MEYFCKICNSELIKNNFDNKTLQCFSKNCEAEIPCDSLYNIEISNEGKIIDEFIYFNDEIIYSVQNFYLKGKTKIILHKQGENDLFPFHDFYIDLLSFSNYNDLYEKVKTAIMFL